jgi:Lon protease-like protein
MTLKLPTSEDLSRLPIFPLPQATLFPGALLPLHVFEPRYRDLTRDVLADNQLMGIARLKPGFEADYEGRPPVFEVCGVGRVIEHKERPDGRYDLTLAGVARVRIVAEHPPDRAYRAVRAELLVDTPPEPALVVALEAQIATLWRALRPHLPESVRDLRELTRDAADAGVYADRLAATLIGDPDVSQCLLTEVDPAERLRMLVERLQELADTLAPASPRSATRWN